MNGDALKDLLFREDEVQMLLDDVNTHYGYDFRNYAQSSLIRRLSRIMHVSKLPSFAEMRYKVIHDEEFFEYFLQEVTVNVTEMFRDPEFFNALRKEVLPLLSTYPLIRIWHAGCSTGEEVYSMAIMLLEEGLLHRSLLYATDLNQHVLEIAKRGAYSMQEMKLNTENYISTGGNQELSSYYEVKNGQAIFSDILKNRMIFSMHNLEADQSFNEFNLIVCRNVLIYFNKSLQDKVLRLFNESLSNFGFLVLGVKEFLNFTDIKENFKPVNQSQKIYKRKN